MHNNTGLMHILTARCVYYTYDAQRKTFDSNVTFMSYSRYLLQSNILIKIKFLQCFDKDICTITYHAKNSSIVTGN